MSTISIAAASRDTFIRLLSALDAWLDKAAANAAERNFDMDVLLNGRLAPDMHPLMSQIRRATDFARNGAGRLAQAPAIEFEGEERTLAEAKARIARTIQHLRDDMPDAGFAEAQNRRFTVRAGADRTLDMSGEEYLLTSALPNFYFHVSMAYAILRHNGVPVGKKDFLQ